jgi:hypothetical protein
MYGRRKVREKRVCGDFRPILRMRWRGRGRRRGRIERYVGREEIGRRVIKYNARLQVILSVRSDTDKYEQSYSLRPRSLTGYLFRSRG